MAKKPQDTAPADKAPENATATPPPAAPEAGKAAPAASVKAGTGPTSLLRQAISLLAALDAAAAGAREASDHLPQARHRVGEVVTLLRDRDAFLGSQPPRT